MYSDLPDMRGYVIDHLDLQVDVVAVQDQTDEARFAQQDAAAPPFRVR